MNVKPTNRRPRRGLLMIEALVSFSLLIAVMAFTGPLFVRNARLMADQRAYRLAVEELTNQIDTLSTLTPDETTARLGSLAPSPTAGRALTGATISGRIEPSTVGHRITLTLAWPANDRGKPPVSLVGWIAAPQAAPAPSNPPEANE